MPRHQHSRCRRALLVPALAGAMLAASSVAPPPVRAAQADDLLAAAAHAAAAPIPVRATATVGRDGASDAGVVLQRGRVRYVETRAGTRALVKPGKVVVRDGARLRKAAPDATLDGSNVLLSDLAVVSPLTRRTPQISDTGPMGTVLTWAPPPPSPYALVVETFDPAQSAVTRTKYYEESISNLVKMRRDAGYTSVGGRPKPGEIVMDTVRPASTTTIALAWSEAPQAPALGLDLLRGPSQLAP
ncbi:MAG: hypothetical protein KIT14_06050 [bacterium]|nr:hypothetical protein [bacterium]